MTRPSVAALGRATTRSLKRSAQRRGYAAAASSAKLNKPIDFRKSIVLNQSEAAARKAFKLENDAPVDFQNLHSAINTSMHHAMKTDESVLLFGEDVAFGGVFRCSKGLTDEFGTTRVFNTPLSEQGIVGFGIGCAAEGMKPIAEIQFADYVFPAFDQIVNEAAKFRYREGGTGGHCGGLVIRMPCGSVGHGALYHSQSPESLFSHVPGMRVVMPRSPAQAKGMLTSAILHSNDPVIFMEPKILYRASEEYVPRDPYTLPLDKAEVVKEGKDLTVISYGQPMYLCGAAIDALEKEIKGLNIELVDLRAIYPWDRETVLKSVNKTGRAVVVHESMLNAGVGAEVAASIQEGAFLRLEAPVARVTGWSVHSGLIFEKFNVPDIVRIYDAIKRTLNY
ncbi:2-oxoisovalerate dehydrogenase subunit beta, mitochondrial [Cyphellophora attinorum]|uniref:3-methyl-2-oxobutanoate dehydrogenase (2-methylpropanoyl-transferring) n=1 Tax=Cyphellophora attinorum TaxID=1664694 RepID=A0A0N1NZ88_9EURO|nr:2-oxoisovalerate dehydrogenase subunit beta, mitochondrial [Phialophora attinorum]KPI40165.1 2-oxoisovalerate dehydrogenase subunit beta, mitochondrial [Phialophora attinorum]